MLLMSLIPKQTHYPANVKIKKLWCIKKRTYKSTELMVVSCNYCHQEKATQAPPGSCFNIHNRILTIRNLFYRHPYQHGLRQTEAGRGLKV